MIEKPILKKQVSRSNENNASPVSPTTQVVRMNSRDLDRNRAKRAWEFIATVHGKEYEGKYGSIVRDLPTMIQINGLAQTLAFLHAKGKKQDSKGHIQAFAHLSGWVCDHLTWGEGDLLKRVLKSENTQHYRQATGEALAFLQWLKRFAEAELKSEEDGR